MSSPPYSVIPFSFSSSLADLLSITFLSSRLFPPPSGGRQRPAGGGATGSGTQPGPVRHHGPTEAGRDQGADPTRDPQGAEDQRRCREPAKGKITLLSFSQRGTLLI